MKYSGRRKGENAGDAIWTKGGLALVRLTQIGVKAVYDQSSQAVSSQEELLTPGVPQAELNDCRKIDKGIFGKTEIPVGRCAFSASPLIICVNPESSLDQRRNQIQIPQARNVEYFRGIQQAMNKEYRVRGFRCGSLRLVGFYAKSNTRGGFNEILFTSHLTVCAPLDYFKCSRVGEGCHHPLIKPRV